MTPEWKVKEPTNQQIEIQRKLEAALDLSPILARLLVQRGVTSPEEAHRFFKPSLNDLHDPFLMADMDKAVKRLTNAIHHKERILIYGDYDVDGTTSVSLVFKFIKKFYDNIDFYIPDRYNEGYGISIQGIDFANAQGCKLIIALDCGIKAIEKVAYARNAGIDFIICDHHTPDEQLPEAVAVLDPKRSDCNYPYKHLSGCGVGFKLLQAFSSRNDIPFSELEPLLDLLALSIASDIVPITGENRILAYYGLKQLNTHPSVGVKSILDVCGLSDKEISISDIVFKIGPRINASGRMKLATEAVELMVSNDINFAREKSDTINEYNNDRKDLDKNITDEAIRLIASNEEYSNRKSIVVYKPDWHKGVIGIVASRLAEEFYKPAVVLTFSNGLASGSARSVPGFDVYKAIDSCRDLLENFGGHRYAAGLSMKAENVPLFEQRMEQFVACTITEEQMLPQIDIDAVISFSEISPRFVNVLKQFSPFGPGNAKPVFATYNVKDAGPSKLVGKDQDHLKLDLTDESTATVMNGIAFGMGKHHADLKAKKPIDICYTIEENNFAGSTTTQLLIKSIV